MVLRNICLMLLLFSLKAQAANIISDIRIWQAPDHSKVVLAMSENVNYQMQYSSTKSQLVISLPDTSANSFLDRALKNDKRIAKIRTRNDKGKMLVAIDLKVAVRPKSFLALPNTQYGHRLIIDLQDMDDVNIPVKSVPKDNKLLVAIDAGHGGEDVGATGVNKLQEKNVVLAIAQDLSEYIKRSPDMRAVMIREGDYYLSLKNRVKKAEELNADIFISIHADAYKDDSAKGSSVYILSKKGSSSDMAKWLANKENSADVIGGVPIEEVANDVLGQVLADLVSSANFKDSKSAATQVLRSFSNSQLIDIHSRKVEYANFFVLKQNKIPAILIETGFMSNPDEELKLEDADYRLQIARLIFDALKEFKKIQ